MHFALTTDGAGKFESSDRVPDGAGCRRNPVNARSKEAVAATTLFFGPAEKIIRMMNPTHGVLNVSGRRCQTSTD